MNLGEIYYQIWMDDDDDLRKLFMKYFPAFARLWIWWLWFVCIWFTNMILEKLIEGGHSDLPKPSNIPRFAAIYGHNGFHKRLHGSVQFRPVSRSVDWPKIGVSLPPGTAQRILQSKNEIRLIGARVFQKHFRTGISWRKPVWLGNAEDSVWEELGVEESERLGRREHEADSSGFEADIDDGEGYLLS